MMNASIPRQNKNEFWCKVCLHKLSNIKVLLFTTNDVTHIEVMYIYNI